MPHLARRPRPLLAIVVAVVMTAAALVFASTAGAASPRSQIDAYAAKHASKVGSATSAFGSVRKYGRTVTYRSYSKSFVVHNGTAVKRVSGSMLRSYVELGGVKGSLGAPVTAKRCATKGSACLQRFQHGSIYRDASAPSRVAVSRHSGEVSELVAVARSQRGYDEPSYRNSKYGRYVNGGKRSNMPWCSFFVSWVSYASFNGRAIPKSNTFTKFKKATRARLTINRKPAVGKIALIDYFGDGRTSHAGLVVAVRKNSVVTIEGNIDARGGASHPRGVHQVVRPKSRVNYYATPDL